MSTITDILAGFTYVELINLLGLLNQHYHKSSIFHRHVVYIPEG